MAVGQGSFETTSQANHRLTLVQAAFALAFAKVSAKHIPLARFVAQSNPEGVSLCILHQFDQLAYFRKE